MILLPGGLPSLTRSEWEAGILQGTSSVELELTVPLQEEDEGEELAVPAVPPAPVETFLDEGVLADWKAAGLQNDPPRYPLTARANGWEGTVVVRAWVGPAGRAEWLEVFQESGHAILDQAALKAIREWTFTPARKNGKVKSSWVEIPVSFRLKIDERK